MVDIYNLILIMAVSNHWHTRSLKTDQSVPVSLNEPTPAGLTLTLPVFLLKRHNYSEDSLDTLQGRERSQLAAAPGARCIQHELADGRHRAVSVTTAAIQECLANNTFLKRLAVWDRRKWNKARFNAKRFLAYSSL